MNALDALCWLAQVWPLRDAVLECVPLLLRGTTQHAWAQLWRGSWSHMFAAAG